MVFFFQAEDGIRDLVRSRGLGDVYKRQINTRTSGLDLTANYRTTTSGGNTFRLFAGYNYNPVSYTHLTLPTSDLV